MIFELKKFHHDSGKGIYSLSKRVKPRQHAQLAEDMAKWLADTNGSFSGEFSSAYAISHCQVEEEPIHMFVVASQLVEGVEKSDGKHTQKNFYFPASAIFNAQILEAPEELEVNVPNRVVATNPATGKQEMRIVRELRKVSNKTFLKEACMSWSHRSEKNVERFHRIKVRYQYLKKLPLIGYVTMRRTEWVEGLKAHIFQHEDDHAKGKNIFFK